MRRTTPFGSPPGFLQQQYGLGINRAQDKYGRIQGHQRSCSLTSRVVLLMLTSIVLIMVVMVYEKIQFSNYMNPTTIPITTVVLSLFKEEGARIGAVSPFPPRRFDNASIHTTKVLATLGPNILTVYSGCRMARWVYPFRPHSNVTYNNWKHDDCNAVNPNKLLRTISQLSENDTIYVLHTRLRHFVEQLKLEELLVDIVVISGQWALVALNEQEDIDYVVAHPRVICWFIQNLDVYGGNNYNNTGLKRHPKVYPFPYGIQERSLMMEKPKQLFMEQYKDAFMMALTRDDADDGNTSAMAVPRIYAGHLRSLGSRKGMDVTKKLERGQFYAVLSQHDYVLSPDGDRPECYRHYEALGLGTVPLTQLDYNVHRHFIGTGLIFNNTVWSVQELETKLSMNPTVNRNAALEEYWMEYVDWVVQRHLTWYDKPKQEPTTMVQLLSNLTF